MHCGSLYCVDSILHCAMVVMDNVGCILWWTVVVLSALDVYCSVPLMSQLSLLYIAVQYGCHNCIILILKYAVVFIAMVDITILIG